MSSRCEVRDLTVTVGGDVAFCHSLDRLSATPHGAPEGFELWFRATICLRKIEGTWLITHEHNSTPFSEARDPAKVERLLQAEEIRMEVVSGAGIVDLEVRHDPMDHHDFTVSSAAGFPPAWSVTACARDRDHFEGGGVASSQPGSGGSAESRQELLRLTHGATQRVQVRSVSLQ